MSSWWFIISNFKWSDQPPVTNFFSSNFTTTALTTIYANVKNEIGDKEINKVKALRIVDRIRGLATELELIGSSRRSDNDYAKVWTT